MNMLKKTMLIGKMKNYEIVMGKTTQGFAILFEQPIISSVIAKYVGNEVKITIEELESDTNAEKKRLSR